MIKDELAVDPKFYEEVQAIAAKYNLGKISFKIANEGKGKLLPADMLIESKGKYEATFTDRVIPSMSLNRLKELQTSRNDLDLNSNWLASFWLISDCTLPTPIRYLLTKWSSHLLNSGMIRSYLAPEKVMISVMYFDWCPTLYIDGRYVCTIIYEDDRFSSDVSTMDLLLGLIGFVQEFTKRDYTVSMYSLTMLDKPVADEDLVTKYRIERDYLISKG